MTNPYFVTLTILLLTLTTHVLQPSNALGSGATIAVTGSTACGITASQNRQNIQCLNGNKILPEIPFISISGGRRFFCGLVPGGYALLCWDTVSFTPKRVYFNYSEPLESIAVGDDHVCGVVSVEGFVKCWRREKGFKGPDRDERFAMVSSGDGFSCGILKGSKKVRCWGRNVVGKEIEREFEGILMSSLVAGGEHVCGLNSSGFLVCKGKNGGGQLDVPGNSATKYSSLALGGDYSCGIRQSNGTVVCWGGEGGFSMAGAEDVSFEYIVSGKDIVCGLVTRNFSMMCWGPEWSNEKILGRDHPLWDILPGPCVQSNCACGIYPDSGRLCRGNGNICKPCFNSITLHPPMPSPQFLNKTPAPLPANRGLRKGLLVFAVVGSVGVFSGICAIIYFLWAGGCLGNKKIHNSVQPTINTAGSSENSASKSIQVSRSFSIKSQSSRTITRQRSGTSSKRTDSAEEFSLAELAAATNNFSPENKVGSGSFGVVYRGKFVDGREVAIKRGANGSKAKKFQEKERAYESELTFLSRLHHKHLVRLVGYCQERDERLLVYEYMANGALYDHLHSKNNINKNSSVLNSWKTRIKIALDAARGIEYLHNYAVPPIIHRDIKSSNILLDESWTARISDLGLSLMGPDMDRDYKPMKAAGTVGYIDPEYYGLNMLTTKSDIYGLGVVLLELLTGKRALFRKAGKETPVGLVDYAVPSIKNEDLASILDPRVGPPDRNETEAVELMAYVAMHCVHSEGKERPGITDVVANLERAVASCDNSDGSDSVSSNAIVIIPD